MFFLNIFENHNVIKRYLIYFKDKRKNHWGLEKDILMNINLGHSVI